MLPAKEITKLYHIYGFEDGPSTEQYLVFYSQRGYFQNAEIVVLDEALDCDDINKEEYEALGFSVRIRKYANVAEAHDTLFNGFFSVPNSNRKLRTEYDDFCDQQSVKLNDGNYEYISGSFAENGSIRSSSIIERINNLFAEEGRQLIILEASAGYGKTCTSYEVIQSLINNFPKNITILTELSKNRRANIFRYVLLSEIDQKFPMLSSDLVTYEISCGRVFLIIDGFDELLSKKYVSRDEKAKDAQTMLDTIAQLFSSNSKAKVVLTTRKSSIFVGEVFDNWVDKHLNGCNITRLQLSAPSLRNWLGDEKVELLEKNNVDLSNILNPVLLSHLRTAPMVDFEEKYNSNHAVIMQYLNLMLQREQARQALHMSVKEQLIVMENLAAQMVQYDISSESTDSIEAILSDIVSPQFHKYQERYEFSETKPSESEFLNKLSHHTLLDRVSSSRNQIGFLNDFIFGFLIAEAVCNKYLKPTELAGKYLDLAITAYSAENLETRQTLYGLIRPVLDNETIQRQLNAAMLLNDSFDGTYRDEYLDSIEFDGGFSIFKPMQFQNCIFSGCVFKNCCIHVEAFKGCQFYNCSFYGVTIQADQELDQELAFFSCHGHEDFETRSSQKSEEVPLSIDYERIVLEQFWKPGYEKAEPRRADETMLKGIRSKDRPAASRAIESLVRKGILTTHLHSFYLNFEKIDEIKEIVKR